MTLKAPAMFNIRNTEKTLITRTQGTKIASNGLKDHVFDVSLVELQNDEIAFRKSKLITEDMMMEIMIQEVQTNDFKEMVNKLTPDSTRKYIEKACQSIYPLHDVFVRKVRILKPKFELRKLMELSSEGSGSGKATGNETGTKGERAGGYEP
ncbi:40S ribosomal protein S3a-like [Tupaia chinensis]|uniref:40S ribosomal protein S3a-like n=1 Tax=Tupaia chinensis TaxID=246437 RepID=UPI00070466C4|nr:40S ribosomal protein S3a-like [Tupaia chinensis]